MLPTPVTGVRLADAVKVFLDTIVARNTRATYAAASDRLVKDFGPDTNVALLAGEPDRVAGRFVYVWGNKSAKTFNIRLTALGSACAYWRRQEWLDGDPLVRLRARPTPPDHSRALSEAEIAEIFALDVALRERVLWHLLYETSAGAEEVLMLDVADLDAVNRCATVTRKGGVKDVIAWQTGTARLLPRMLAGRHTGPVVPDRPQGAALGRPHRPRPDHGVRPVVVSAGGRAVRDPHRAHDTRAVHAAPAAAFPVDARRGERRVHTDADGVVRAHLGTLAGQVREGVCRGPQALAGADRSCLPPKRPLTATFVAVRAGY
jgi:integrase